MDLLASVAAQAVAVLVIGTVRGFLYSLIAVGFALIFGVGGVINLAHGTFYMLGAYFTYIWYTRALGGAGWWPLVASMVLAVVTVSLLSVVMFRVLLKSLTIETEDYVLAMSLAVALFVHEVMAHLFGVAGTNVPPVVEGNTSILGVRVINQELLVVPVAMATLGGLAAFLGRTNSGRAIVAVAQSRTGAVLMGVDTRRVLVVVMALSGAMAALAGALISAVRVVVPDMWVFPLIKAFTIVILGGLGSLGGAIIGSFFLGYAEVATSLILNEQYAEMIALVIIVIVLLTRPTGLFGSR